MGENAVNRDNKKRKPKKINKAATNGIILNSNDLKFPLNKNHEDGVLVSQVSIKSFREMENGIRNT